MNMPRLAVVGYGKIARQHLEAFRALGAEICAVCNRSPEGRERARTEAGIERAYADPLEMARREKPDGLLVTASVLSIYPVARRLIPLGIPILLEKPPGTSLRQAKALARLAQDHHTHVMVGLNRRYYSVYHRALEQLGGPDSVTGVHVEWSEDPAAMIRLGHPPELLPTLNFANSLHGLDLLTFFAGPVTQMRAWGRNLDSSRKEFRWQMGLEGLSEKGTRVSFSSNWDVPGRWRLIVDAPGRRLVSAPLETGQVLRRGESALELEPSSEDRQFKPGLHGQAVAFLQVIRSGRSPLWPACTLEESVHSMALAERLTRACEES